MAGSRLASHGTIFSRMTGLLETGAIKERPVWYNVYKRYKPELEPYIDRPIPAQNPILEIVYEEDFTRAKKLVQKEVTPENAEPLSHYDREITQNLIEALIDESDKRDKKD